jgi:polar amino acid transport system substrate-binding protein
MKAAGLFVAALLLSPLALLPAADKPTGRADRSALRTWQRIQGQGYFTVSLDPDNLPYSSRDGKQKGIEVELGHALAKQLGLTATIHWLPTAHQTSLGALLAHKCDLVMGLPIDPRLHDDDDPAGSRIAYTRPYCRTGYLLFVRKTGPRIKRLDELKGEQSNRLGTQAGTLADFALKQRGYQRKLYGSQESALKAVADGQIDFAYLWSNAAWLVRPSEKPAVEIVQPYELEDWRDMAIAVRGGDDEFRKQLDRALAELVQQQVIERLLTRYHLPYYPPTEAKAKPSPRDRPKP